ncbi:SipW-dependent-type signal peptide-containing protein [Halosolutus amylolyticus]|uniref:SipW-dependent-type signal peptide-containing protein n=1 Tax=Halosolutus amylolyticus TaxID=2932267 RepID=A0ABD5PW01_9EURY|nr:SipW-dependent-type signal peptide-containing protein [Halosolutus amylolyticus]
MTEDRSYSLSRRQVIGGLGAIGVASAGAGLGTTAYFNDEESFDDNSLAAGELDLYVHYEFTADQDGVEGENLGEPTSGTVQGGVDEHEGDEVSVSYGLADVKPGDSGSLDFCFSIVDNPAFVWAGGELTANDENGYTEPEPETQAGGDANDPGDPNGEGELADAIEATLRYCGEDADGATVDGDAIESGTLKEVLAALADGIALDGDGNGDAEPGDRVPFEGVEEPDEHDDTCVCLEWEVPTSVGNEIQTDSVEFDLAFHAEQSRHNTGENNPFADDSDGNN